MKEFVALLPLLIAQVDPIQQPKPPFSLSVDQVKFITDTRGVIMPDAVVKAAPGDTVKMYLTDGTVYSGIVKEIQFEIDKFHKVYGDVTDHPNTGFGFAVAKGGVFAGAIVERDTNTTYTVQFNEAIKGFIFVKQTALTNI